MQRYNLHIPAGVKVLREKGSALVTLSAEVFVSDAVREEDGAFVYSIGKNRYCVSAGCCHFIEMRKGEQHDNRKIEK